MQNAFIRTGMASVPVVSRVPALAAGSQERVARACYGQNAMRQGIDHVNVTGQILSPE